MSYISLENYPQLKQYGVLAAGALTSTNVITVNGGAWYGSPNTTNNGFVRGTLSPGYKVVGSTAALNQLDTLIVDILALTNMLTGEDIYPSNEQDRIFYPNTNYYTNQGVAYSSKTLTFDGLGNPDAQFFITANQVAITLNSATIVLANGAKACNIFWLATGEAVGAFIATDTSVPGNIITTADFTCTSDAAPNITFTGHIFSKRAATLTRSGAGSLTINVSTCNVVCYAKGTLILTKQGYVPIENIKAGHTVVTQGKIYNNNYTPSKARIEPVVWVSKFKVKEMNKKSKPICIKKDSLGRNTPFKDLYVSPGHSLLLNGKMVLAKDIVNNQTIYQDDDCVNIEYYHLECEEHSAIFANGVLSESYLDVKNRHVFENSVKLRRRTKS